MRSDRVTLRGSWILILCLGLAGVLSLGCPVDDDDDISGDDDDATRDDDDVVDQWTLGTIVDTEGTGVAAQMDGPWGKPLWVVRVQGSHYEMGYQYGRMMGPTMMDMWWLYMDVLGEEMGATNAEDADFILGNVLDLAWGHFEPHVPPSFAEEFEGLAAGMADAGVEYGSGDEDLAKIPRRIVTLIDMAMSSALDFDDIAGFVSFLQDGYTDDLLAYYGMESATDGSPDDELGPLMEAIAALQGQGDGVGPRGPFLNCSYFAGWSQRTVDGGLYATRNMDFTTDSGLNDFASIVAFVPDDGVAHASVSWVGANLGVLAGISREGLAVSAVGASSPYERAATEPQILKAREVLQEATDIETALPFMSNEMGDGIVRAPTIGYNALLAWGDPRGGGAGAEAAILETNGLEIGVFHHRSDCSVEESLVRFAYEGDVDYVWTPDDHPEWVPAEADAVEIDGLGQPRLFAHDGAGNLITDAHGNYTPDPVDGIPIQTGYPEDCALYRGDEAMNYGVRTHQTAANGPANGGDGLMIHSGSYRGRYWPMREMTLAYAGGTEYVWEDEVVIPDNGGAPVLIGLDEAEAISRVAAMDSNVYDVVYDATNLVVRVSFESGAGENWLPASEQPSFLEIDLAALFLVP